jgi:hypothetical protein
VLADGRTLERHALADSDADEAELVALDAHMARTVYLARNALVAAAAREGRLRQDIRQALRQPASIPTLIEQLAEGALQKDLPKEDLVSAARIFVRALPPLDIFMSGRTNARREEQAIRADLRLRDANCIPVVWTVPGRGEWVLQLHAARGATLDAARGLGAVMSRLAEYRDLLSARLRFFDESDLQELLLAPIAQDLIVAGLAIAFGDQLRWEWGLTAGPKAVFASRANARELVATETKATISRPDSAARRAELELLHNMLLGRPTGVVLASIASLRGFAKGERVPIVEFDCCLIEEYADRLSIHLGEAKTGSTSVNAARTQLRMALERLPIDPAVELKPAKLMRSPLRKNQGSVRSRATATLTV